MIRCQATVAAAILFFSYSDSLSPVEMTGVFVSEFTDAGNITDIHWLEHCVTNDSRFSKDFSDSDQFGLQDIMG